jgi:hypothetical protein
MFEANEETREFKLDGHKVLSVSEILDSAGLTNFCLCGHSHAVHARDHGCLKACGCIAFKTVFDKESAWRGSVVHRCLELAIQGRLDMASVHPELTGYVKSGIALWEAMNLKAVMIEKRLVHHELKFVGKPDFVHENDSQIMIGDWKSGEALPSTAWQLAGYEILVRFNTPIDNKVYKPIIRAAIELDKSGAMAKLIPYMDRNDKHVFMAALTVAHAKK